MANSSETFKSGEIVLAPGEYECLLCRQMEKASIRSFETGAIFGYCEACGIKDGTWRLRPPAKKR